MDAWISIERELIVHFIHHCLRSKSFLLSARYAVHISRAPASHKFLSPISPLAHIPIRPILIIFHQRIHRNARSQLPSFLPHTSSHPHKTLQTSFEISSTPSFLEQYVPPLLAWIPPVTSQCSHFVRVDRSHVPTKIAQVVLCLELYFCQGEEIAHPSAELLAYPIYTVELTRIEDLDWNYTSTRVFCQIIYHRLLRARW